MPAHVEDLQGLRVGAEQEADLQARAAFKHIFAQSPDGDAHMAMRLAETIGQDFQRLFRTIHFCVAQILERGEETRAEYDGGVSHVSASP